VPWHFKEKYQHTTINMDGNEDDRRAVWQWCWKIVVARRHWEVTLGGGCNNDVTTEVTRERENS
jgi:hypothetical protein